MAPKPQMPESILEEKEFCFNCGRMLGKGSKGVKVTVESIAAEERGLAVESDVSYFCEHCAKTGVSITLRGASSDI